MKEITKDQMLDFLLDSLVLLKQIRQRNEEENQQIDSFMEKILKAIQQQDEEEEAAKEEAKKTEAIGKAAVSTGEDAESDENVEDGDTWAAPEPGTASAPPSGLAKPSGEVETASRVFCTVCNEYHEKAH